MKKCYECGMVFEDDEAVEKIEPHGETFLVCPYCGGGYEKAHKCKCCGETFGESELIEGICENCIEESVTVDNVKKYLESSGLFSDFMIRAYYGFDVLVGELLQIDEKEVDFKALFEEKATVKNLSKLCEKYIYSEDLENFAEWLSLEKRKEVS